MRGSTAELHFYKIVLAEPTLEQVINIGDKISIINCSFDKSIWKVLFVKDKSEIYALLILRLKSRSIHFARIITHIALNTSWTDKWKMQH